MRVLIADRHDQVRSALRLLLEQELSVETVGEALDIASLLAETERCHADVLFLDWGLAAEQPERVVAALRRRRPDLRIIALSSRPEDRRAAATAGIDQFVSKNAFSEELLAALRGLDRSQRPTQHET
ncbi:MAG: response regulator [Anaerolineae bacterium]|nr:response regulator [Anaerolineae bacterium]